MQRDRGERGSCALGPHGKSPELGCAQIFRLSGTGSVGATIRVYIEQFVSDPSKIDGVPAEILAPLVRSHA